MKTYCLAFGTAILLTLSSCNKTSSIQSGQIKSDSIAAVAEEQEVIPKIHTRTITITGTSTNEVRTKTTSTVDDARFEMTLWKMSDTDTYEARWQLFEPASAKDHHNKFIEIVDIGTPDTASIRFQKPTDFITFMAERGYDVTFEKKVNDRIDYVFKRK
jgi:hypothetical protein